jgi:hypothetical protein
VELAGVDGDHEKADGAADPDAGAVDQGVLAQPLQFIEHGK